MKRKLSLILVAAMMLTLLAGCGPKEPTPSGSQSGTQSSTSQDGSSSADLSTGDSSTGDTSTVEIDLPDFMVMSGPTGVGAAKLLADHDADPAASPIASGSVVTDNEAVKNAIISGEADIAAVATNLAATLVNKLEGGIEVLAVNTLGVLYILEKGDTVHSMADLAGKTLYATGQGANPEYILNFLLTQSGVDPADVDIQWLTAQEITAKMATEESGICMLPVPAATALMMKDGNVREAVSLTQVWEESEQGALAQGCIVVRTDYAQENPQAVEDFLAAYEDSITFMNDEANRPQAAAMVAQYGITANEKIAAAAIPQCNLTFVTGTEMRDILTQFYQVLFQANPAAIGGAMPYDSFYYGAD